MKYFVSSLVVFIVFSCHPSKYSLNTKTIKEIGICYYYNSSIPKDIQDIYKAKLDGFINEYNGENHKFKIIPCVDSSNNSLIIWHDDINFVSKKSIFKSTCISTLGISIFVIMASNLNFAVGYIQFPGDRSNLRTNLSGNLSNMKDYKNLSIFNIDYSLNKQKNINKHWTAIEKSLKRELYKIEKEIKNDN